MKLLFSKLSSLILILIGIVLMGQLVQCPYICSYIAKIYDGTLDVGFPGSTLLALAIIFILIGGYSLLPSLKSRTKKYKILKQNFESGYAEIDISSLEKECSAMLKRIVPLKQVSISLFPEKENKLKAIVSPVAVLDDEQNLPKIEQIISSRLKEFLNDYFGIELSTPIVLKIDEFQIEPEKIYHLIEKTEEKETPPQEEPTSPTNYPPPPTITTTPSEEPLQQPLPEPLQCKPETDSEIFQTTTNHTNNLLKCKTTIDSTLPPLETHTQETTSDTSPKIELPENKEDSEPLTP